MHAVPSKKSRTVVFALLVVGIAVAFVVHLSVGSGSALVSLSDVATNLWNGFLPGDSVSTIVWKIRLPRTLAALLAGGILGCVGSAFQAFFRNALAEPYVIGVSSGAGLGGALAIALGLSQSLNTLGIVVFAFVGGIGSLWLVLALARRGGGVSVYTLLLAGVVVGALLYALTTTVLLLGGQDTNRVLKWLLGDLGTVFNERLWAMALVLILGTLALQTQTRWLNAFSVDEFSSGRLGVDHGRLRRVVLVTGTAMVSVCVGTVGVIGFLGLIAPHIARRVLGLDLRFSLIGSALAGSLTLLLADLLAMNASHAVQLPVGAVTAILGAPVLLILLKIRG